jgi:hypothetical protein
MAGDPRGQCGVSSVWLAEVLAHEYSIGSTFCRGSLILGEDEVEELMDHCWLEIDGGSGEELILDVTCDQAWGFDEQIVFNWRSVLDRQRVRYVARNRIDLSDLAKDRVWPRYQTLLGNIERVKTRGEPKNQVGSQGPLDTL